MDFIQGNDTSPSQYKELIDFAYTDLNTLKYTAQIWYCNDTPVRKRMMDIYGFKAMCPLFSIYKKMKPPPIMPAEWID